MESFITFMMIGILGQVNKHTHTKNQKNSDIYIKKVFIYENVQK